MTTPAPTAPATQQLPVVQFLIDDMPHLFTPNSSPTARALKEAFVDTAEWILTESPAEATRLAKALTSHIVTTQPPVGTEPLPLVESLIAHNERAHAGQLTDRLDQDAIAAYKAGMGLASACAMVAAQKEPYIDHLCRTLSDIAPLYNPTSPNNAQREQSRIFDTVLAYLQQAPALATHPAVVANVHELVLNPYASPHAAAQALAFLAETQTHPIPEEHGNPSSKNQLLATVLLSNPYHAPLHAAAWQLATNAEVPPVALAPFATRTQDLELAGAVFTYALGKYMGNPQQHPLTPDLEAAARTRLLGDASQNAYQQAVTLYTLADPASHVPELVRTDFPPAPATLRGVANAMLLSPDPPNTQHFNALMRAGTTTIADPTTGQPALIMNPQLAATLQRVTQQHGITSPPIDRFLEQSRKGLPTPRDMPRPTTPHAQPEVPAHIAQPRTGHSH